MTQENKHQSRPETEELFDRFPPEERIQIKRIWQLSSKLSLNRSQVAGEETEKALKKVHSRIPDFNNPGETGILTHHWRWVAAAAVLLLAVGAGFLLTPVSVSVPYGETTSIELPDGSRVDLNSGSHLQYSRLFAFNNRTVNLDGEAFFSVESGEHPFRVKLSNTTVQVTGTKFNVRSWSNEPGKETEVAVTEGNVQLYPTGQQNKAVTLHPGQFSSFNEGMDSPTLPESIVTDRVGGWRNQQFIFNDKSLVVIFRELERRFDLEIRLEDDSVASETLTTYYANPQNAESILADLCRVKGLNYAKTANGYRVYQNRD